MRRQQAHRQLQQKAKQWLSSSGFRTSIEVAVGQYRVDVSGRKGNQIAVIECGNTPKVKLDWLLTSVDLLYIWPFRAPEPVFYHGQPLKFKRPPRVYMGLEISSVRKLHLVCEDCDLADVGRTLIGDLYCQRCRKKSNLLEKNQIYL